MKKIKFFPAPHVEVRVHVSDQMEEDMKRCDEYARSGITADCDTCSWYDVRIDDISACTFPEVMDEVLGKEDKQII